MEWTGGGGGGKISSTAKDAAKNYLLPKNYGPRKNMNKITSIHSRLGYNGINQSGKSYFWIGKALRTIQREKVTIEIENVKIELEMLYLDT
ncbi:MAG: hypothetical protein LN566_07555 [Rickettsia endosymbiont of Stiretrus anchorago]|nr:hypothetical protein [Rickettsia endosymbiont of Stiretrus anchorago]